MMPPYCHQNQSVYPKPIQSLIANASSICCCFFPSVPVLLQPIRSRVTQPDAVAHGNYDLVQFGRHRRCRHWWSSIRDNAGARALHGKSMITHHWGLLRIMLCMHIYAFAFALAVLAYYVFYMVHDCTIPQRGIGWPNMTNNVNLNWH